jgi:hypothetical protein
MHRAPNHSQNHPGAKPGRRALRDRLSS